MLHSAYLVHRLVISDRLPPAAATADGGRNGTTAITSTSQDIWKQNKSFRTVKQIREMSLNICTKRFLHPPTFHQHDIYIS
jgi:hypothetical protein